MGFFKVKSKKNLDHLEIGEVIEESDFSTLTPDGNFIQLEYIEEDLARDKIIAKPGIYTIMKDMSGLHLEKTSFTKDAVLESFVSTKEITDKIDLFFNNMGVYQEFGFDIAKRGMLLFGPAGTGKSTAIGVVANRYTQDNKTMVLIWNTDKYEAHMIKDFIKCFEYEGVEKLILVAEDIGGTEIDQSRMRSDSSLLALLDNQEKTFTISTMIIATTNYPENFMGNLTNRPNRFDDKVEVGYPTSEARQQLLTFFDKRKSSTQEALTLISSKKCEKFSPAHIREVIVRSAIHSKSVEVVINEMLKEIQHYEKAFTKSRSAGFLDD